MSNQYRYSQSGFRTSVVVAIGLTAIVSFLIWLFARLFGFQNSNLITFVSALLFFGFCSATMIWRYAQRAIIVAVRPDGFFDARYSSQAVPWDNIKELRLGRAENDFELNVFLWPNGAAQPPNAPIRPSFVSDLSPLDAGVTTVLEAIAKHKPIIVERA